MQNCSLIVCVVCSPPSNCRRSEVKGSEGDFDSRPPEDPVLLLLSFMPPFTGCSCYDTTNRIRNAFSLRSMTHSASFLKRPNGWLLDGANPTRMKNTELKWTSAICAKICTTPSGRDRRSMLVNIRLVRWPMTSDVLVFRRPVFPRTEDDLRTKRWTVFWMGGRNIVHRENAACTKQWALFHENNTRSSAGEMPPGEHETKPWVVEWKRCIIQKYWLLTARYLWTSICPTGIKA